MEGPLADVFLSRAGLPADAELRARAEAFLKARRIHPSVLRRMPDALLAAYGRHLAAGLPIDYRYMVDGSADPLSGRVRLCGLQTLVAALPAGATVQSLVADFARGVWYSDENRPVFEDVCRASCSGTLDDALSARMRAILQANASWPEDGDMHPPSLDVVPACLALEMDGRVARALPAWHRSYLDTMNALFEAVRR
ncbi:MAG: hypothetical protein IJJ45_11680 [Clostridia bacterium]|nr:hypothetical protein [Clostridia bacterium]